MFHKISSFFAHKYHKVIKVIILTFVPPWSLSRANADTTFKASSTNPWALRAPYLFKNLQIYFIITMSNITKH